MALPLTVIDRIEPGSPADLGGLREGDVVLTINGVRPRDVIDYQLLTMDERFEIEFSRAEDVIRSSIETEGDGRVGIYFAHSVFDHMKICRNRCLFCFVDQLPKDCRGSLLIKDDDFRLSFLYGNFVTLTNLSEAEVERIIEQRLSPLYVSLHSTDGAVRQELVRPPLPDLTMEKLKALLDAGIEIHVQIVVCPGINDGDDLKRTLRTLADGYPGIESVGVVPVGLTRHRLGLSPLRPFSPEQADSLIEDVEVFQSTALSRVGYRWAYAADEFYLMSGREVPAADAYDDYPQLENGIGLTRKFVDEVLDAVGGGLVSGRDTHILQRKIGCPGSGDVAPDECPGSESKARPGSGRATVVTGELGDLIFKSLAPVLRERSGVELDIITASNRWLGGRVTVAALLAGEDIIAAVRESGSAGPVFIPANCLNADGLFLDDLTVDQVSAATGRDIVPAAPNGHDFVEVLFEYGRISV